MKNRALLAIGLCLAGCTSDKTAAPADLAIAPPSDLSTGPAPSPVPPCPAGAKDCVDVRVARICPADGSGWLTVQCHLGSACLAGDCVAPPPLCTAADDACTGNTALHCMVDSSGVGTMFSMTPCPAGTQCFGAGFCKGACVVGSSSCVDLHTVATCGDDGSTTTLSICDPVAQELCVRVADGDLPRAACKASSCTPDPAGCDQHCSGAATLTICNETPSGYVPVPLQCPAGQSCNPTGAACGNARQALCSSTCVDGQQRCTADGSGRQTCAAGQWGPATACTLDGQPARACMIDPTNPDLALCAHPICAAGLPGSCDAQGQLHACGLDGLLAAGAACASGRCVPLTPSASQATSAAFTQTEKPGTCVVECQGGDTRCTADGAPTLQSCQAGAWAQPTACPGNALCYTGLTDGGRPTALCGAACKPSTHRCVDAAGGADGGPDSDGGVSATDDIETCSAAGQWGTPAGCATGLGCQPSAGPPADAICAAECVPGTPVCVGAPVTGTGLPLSGTAQQTRCSSDGRLIDTTTCSSDSGPFRCCNDGNAATDCATCSKTQTCRRHADGSALGCVDCVGANNEDGLADSRCDGSSPEECLGDNTWAPASLVCGGGLVCIAPLTTRPAYCHSIADFNLNPVTETNIIDISDGVAHCTSVPVGNGSFGPPVPCADVPDCCADFCHADVATPAACGVDPFAESR